MTFSDYDKDKIKQKLRGVISNAEELERWITEECGQTEHESLHDLDEIRRKAIKAGVQLGYTPQELTEVRV